MAPTSRRVVDLTESPLFAGLAPADIRALRRVARPRPLEAGETLFREGQRAVGLHVVVEGQVKVFKASPAGKEQILHVMGPGDVLAEVALFSGSTYPASATAVSAARVLLIPRADFRNLVERRPQMALNLIADLSGRLRRFARMVEDLSLKEISARLASYLLDLAAEESLQTSDGPEVVLPMSKAQLAARLGTLAETLSRTLTRFRSAGWIRMRGRRICLVRREALQRAASS